MKTTFLKITALVAFVAFSSCKDKAEEAETKAAEEVAVAKSTAVTFKADTDKSIITWKGFKPTGSHEGTINVKGGTIAINGDTVESGKFTIDMSTIEVTDIPKSEEGNANLQGHLSGPDFFDVAGFPTAEFEVTGFENKDGKSMLSGNLTMKGETNNISFPVKTSVDGDTMTLTSETFTIDRSKWNIKYGSKSFFDDLGDKFINDDIELTVTLLANKA
ncbi:YceI family protein [Winogradskyella sp.]|uniref:YceI family protein n=1 Tax=Winogradskyella sp. TaxID=1883156 RepID=UPI0026062F5A|nr:YceI family protein [uncultured Winogradskyella sp.]